MLINASTIADNRDTRAGDGVYSFNYAVGTLQIRNSTMSDKTDDQAAGLGLHI